MISQTVFELLARFSTMTQGKSKENNHWQVFTILISQVLKRFIKKRSKTVRKTPHRYGNSHAVWDHTVLPATRQIVTENGMV